MSSYFSICEFIIIPYKDHGNPLTAFLVYNKITNDTLTENAILKNKGAKRQIRRHKAPIYVLFR